MAVGQELFSQASAQVNMLLLSQRNMVLVSAFAITLVTFSKNFEYVYIKYLSILLFAFAIASGWKSVDDFNNYISETKLLDASDPSELELLERWSSWANYSYFMLAIVIFILVNVIIIELSKFSSLKWFWEKQPRKKVKNKKVN